MHATYIGACENKHSFIKRLNTLGAKWQGGSGWHEKATSKNTDLNEGNKNERY